MWGAVSQRAAYSGCEAPFKTFFGNVTESPFMEGNMKSILPLHHQQRQSAKSNGPLPFILGVLVLILISNHATIRNWLVQNGIVPASQDNSSLVSTGAGLGSAEATVKRITDLRLFVNAKEEELARDYERSVNDIIRAGDYRVEAAIGDAARSLGTFGAIKDLVWAFAVDEITKRNTALDLADRNTSRVTNAINGLGTECEAASARFTREMQALNTGYANDLLQIVDQNPADASVLRSPEMNANFQALRTGIPLKAAVTVGGLTLDILNRNAIAKSIGVVVAFLRRLLAPLTAKAVGSVAAALVDGPIPIGDIAAVGGLAWTAWDVATFKDSVRKEVASALRTAKAEQIAALKRTTSQHRDEVLVAAARARAEARSMALAAAGGSTAP